MGADSGRATGSRGGDARTRPGAIAGAVAVAALLLAGCGATASPSTSSSGPASPSVTPAASPGGTPGDADAPFALALPGGWTSLDEDAFGVGGDAPPGVTSAIKGFESMFEQLGGQPTNLDLPGRPTFVLAAYDHASAEAFPPVLSCNAMPRGSFPPDEALDGAEEGNLESIGTLAWTRGQPEVDRIDLSIGPTVRIRWLSAPPAGSGRVDDAAAVGYSWVSGPNLATCVFVASPETAAADEPAWQSIVATARARPDWSVSAVVPVGIKPFNIATGFGDVWVASSESGTVSRISPATNRVIATIDMRAGRDDAAQEAPFGIAVDSTRVWVTVMAFDGAGAAIPGRLAAIDPSTNTVSTVIEVGRLPIAVAAAGDALWVANAEDRTVMRADPGLRAVTETIQLAGTVSAIAVGLDAVWALLPERQELIRIDPVSARVTATIEVGGRPSSLAVGTRGVWVATEEALELFDPTSGATLASLELSGIGGLTVDGGSVWAAEALGNHVREVDEASATEVSVVLMNTNGWGIAVADGAVWVVQPAAWDRKWAEAYPGVAVRIDR